MAALCDEERLALARSLYNDKNNKIEDIIATLKVSRATFYRSIAQHKAAHQS